MKRREFIAVLTGAIASPLRAHAQQVRAPVLIAWLGGSSKEAATLNLNAFLQGLRNLGHEDGGDIRIEYRWADGDYSRLPLLAKELVALNPRVVVAAVQSAANALAKETSSIPIVTPLCTDPLGFGVADSYNHPGHNFTGVLMTLDSLPAKQAELLLRVIPHAAVIGVLVNPASAAESTLARNLETAVGHNVRVVPVEARNAADIELAFETLKREQVDGLVILQDILFFTEVRRIIRLVETARIPAIHGFREHVERGGLMSYGVDIPQPHP